MSSAQLHIHGGQESGSESNHEAKTGVPYHLEYEEAVALNLETPIPLNDTPDLVLSDDPSQDQLVMRQLRTVRHSGPGVFKQNPQGGAARSDTSSGHSRLSNKRASMQPIPRTPTPLSILGKQESPYKRPEVHDDTTGYLKRITKVLESISPRKLNAVPGKSIEREALPARYQQMYESLSRTREQLELAEDAQINFNQVDNKIDGLKEKPGEVIEERRRRLKARITKESVVSLGRDNILLANQGEMPQEIGRIKQDHADTRTVTK